MTSLLGMVAAVVAGALLTWALLWREGRPPTDVDLAAHLVHDDGRRAAGRLRMSPDGLTWRESGAAPLPLRGPARLNSVGLSSDEGSAPVRLLLWATAGQQVGLELPEAEAAVAARLLSGTDLPELRPPGWTPYRSARGVGACLGIALTWAALMLLVGTDGYTATATVVENHGDWTCEVSWEDREGERRQALSDCFGEPAGESLEVVVPWGEVDDDLVTKPMCAFVGATLAGPLTGVGGLLAWRTARRRRTDAALLALVDAAPARSRTAAEPALAEERTARAFARTRWYAPAVLLVGLLALAGAVVLGSAQERADRELRARGETTEGTVLEVQPDTRSSSGGADVRFVAEGEAATRHVRLGVDADSYEEGQQVDVLFDPADPDRFTIDGLPYEPPWTTFPLTVAIGGTLLGLGYGTWMARRRRHTWRLLTGAAWERVTVTVEREEDRYWFSTPDGSVWRSGRSADWPSRRVMPDRTGRLRPQPEDVWWVRGDGHAVFSRDKGDPLVRTRVR